MLRGEVRLVDFEPTRSSEANKKRPAIIVSNDQANAAASRLGRGVLTVVPITSNVRRVFPFQVALGPGDTGLRVPSKAQAEQIRSVSVDRIGPALGLLSADQLAAVEQALRLHLQL